MYITNRARAIIKNYFSLKPLQVMPRDCISCPEMFPALTNYDHIVSTVWLIRGKNQKKRSQIASSIELD